MKVHTEPDSIREYDAHVYYHLDHRSEAAALREKAKEKLGCGEVRVGGLVDRPVGPHPLPMFEINFKRSHFETLKNWLSLHRGDHTVLIHEVTGDDPRDHTIGAIWLGDPLTLDLSRLDPSPSK